MRKAIALAFAILALPISTILVEAQRGPREPRENPGRGHQQDRHDNRRSNRTVSVPEPGTLVLIGVGVGSLVAARAWRSRQRSDRK